MRWWRRFWLRYLYYCKEHWLIAASILLTLLWLMWQLLVTIGLEALWSVIVALIEAV